VHNGINENLELPTKIGMHYYINIGKGALVQSLDIKLKNVSMKVCFSNL